MLVLYQLGLHRPHFILLATPKKSRKTHHITAISVGCCLSILLGVAIIEELPQSCCLPGTNSGCVLGALRSQPRNPRQGEAVRVEVRAGNR